MNPPEHTQSIASSIGVNDMRIRSTPNINLAAFAEAKVSVIH
jgi:hypothetical protein